MNGVEHKHHLVDVDHLQPPVLVSLLEAGPVGPEDGPHVGHVPVIVALASRTGGDSHDTALVL